MLREQHSVKVVPEKSEVVLLKPSKSVKCKNVNRIIKKSGERNVGFLNIPRKSVKFLKDFVTTLIEGKWRYTLIVFTMSFFISWTVFAILWLLIADVHGDMIFDEVTGARLGDGHLPCIRGATDFTGFFLLSVETQVTTGYGEKYPTEECPEAIFMMILQLIFGVVIEGAVVGIVYAKMIRPAKKPTNFKFSKYAVICQRDGKLCFIFRVGDSTQAQGINTRIEAFWCEEKKTREGEKVLDFERSLKLEDRGKIILIWPTTICHTIDSSSPMYNLSAKDLMNKKFEIVITLSGSSKSTGQMTQARTSYLPKEILWSHRFINIINYDYVNEVYVTDYENFDTLQQVDTPFCSAEKLDILKNKVKLTAREKTVRKTVPSKKYPHYNCHSEYNLHLNMQVAEIILHPVQQQLKNDLDVEPIKMNDDINDDGEVLTDNVNSRQSLPHNHQSWHGLVASSPNISKY